MFMKMGANISKSEEEIFDTISHNDPKVIALVGPEGAGKTYIYETLCKLPLSKHYIKTKIYCDSTTYINDQSYHIYDCPSNCIIDAETYILVLGKDSDENYIDTMRQKLDSNDIIIVSRFEKHLNMEDIIDIRYDPYTEISIIL